MICPSCKKGELVPEIGSVVACNHCNAGFNDCGGWEHDQLKKRSDKAKWDNYFMRIADAAATLSKDQSTQIGCVIVGPDREIRSTGYNSFPRGVNDDKQARQDRPLKYKWIEHAERNAIYNAARIGVSLRGCIIYCAWLPCTDCARAIIQSGITEVVVKSMNAPFERWEEDMAVAQEMLREAGIGVRKAC